jgi:hypothetical protein
MVDFSVAGVLGAGADAEATEPLRDPLPPLLLADLVEAASDLSGFPFASLKLATEFRGLSVLAVPGILFLRELRSERVESLVSDLSKER